MDKPEELINRHYEKMTICEMHRQIYHKLKEGGKFEDVEQLLLDAFNTAKKMSMKLRQYKRNYDDDWYLSVMEYNKTRLDQKEPILWENADD